MKRLTKLEAVFLLSQAFNNGNLRALSEKIAPYSEFTSQTSLKLYKGVELLKYFYETIEFFKGKMIKIHAEIGETAMCEPCVILNFDNKEYNDSVYVFEVHDDMISVISHRINYPSLQSVSRTGIFPN